MCHIALRHYIHCRHSNLTFHHCHTDTHPSPTTFPLQFPSTSPLSPFPPAPSTYISHPLYAPTTSSPSQFQPSRTSIEQHNHDIPQATAHAYRRLCPACVTAKIRDLVHVDRERSRRERLRRHVRRQWREERAEGEAVEGSVRDGEGHGDGGLGGGVEGERRGSVESEAGRGVREEELVGRGVAESGGDGEDYATRLMRGSERGSSLGGHAEREMEEVEEEGMGTAGPDWGEWVGRQRREVAVGSVRRAVEAGEARRGRGAMGRGGVDRAAARGGGVTAWQRFAVDGLVEEEAEGERWVRRRGERARFVLLGRRAVGIRRIRGEVQGGREVDGGDDSAAWGAQLMLNGLQRRAENELAEIAAERRRNQEVEISNGTVEVSDDASDRSSNNPMPITVDGHADRRAADEMRDLQIVRNDPPATVEAVISPFRSAPEVRQRQQMDLMEQARLYELQIWSQRQEGGGLTPRQRELLQSGPTLVPYPQDIMVEIESALLEITGSPRGYYPPNMTDFQARTYRSFAVAMMVQQLNQQREIRAVSAAHAQINGLDPRVPVRVRFAGVDENGSPRTMEGEIADEDVVMSDEVQIPSPNEPQVNDRFSIDGEDDDSLAREKSDEGPCLPQLGRSDHLRGFLLFDVARAADSNREGWESNDRPSASPSEEVDMASPSAGGRTTMFTSSTPAEIATSDCPCHAPQKWWIVSSLPTHSPHLFQSAVVTPSLADLRDSPFHRPLPVAYDGEELPTADTQEILVSFEACGHSLAVFVPRLQYTDASDIQADCGCYGFDRCLVAARRATSLQECLVCGMKEERDRWARQTERDGSERCPWFEWSVRTVERKRDIGMWPFGAQESRG